MWYTWLYVSTWLIPLHLSVWYISLHPSMWSRSQHVCMWYISLHLFVWSIPQHPSMSVCVCVCVCVCVVCVCVCVGVRAFMRLRVCFLAWLCNHQLGSMPHAQLSHTRAHTHTRTHQHAPTQEKLARDIDGIDGGRNVDAIAVKASVPPHSQHDCPPLPLHTWLIPEMTCFRCTHWSNCLFARQFPWDV